MTQPEVAVLIVTFNSSAVIAACLESTRRTNADVLVIDNASADGTAALVAGFGFRVIANQLNVGFAAAANQGVRATNAPFLLLLNPDVVLETGLEALVNPCKLPHVGAVGGKLVSSDGIPQLGFSVRRFPTPAALICEALLINRLWPGNPVNWRYRCLGCDLAQFAQVEQPAGAFLLFRREAWEQVGGFDAGFFPIWFEDVDFCKRVTDAGFQIFYQPAAVATHVGAHSIAKLKLGERTEYWYCSLLRYSIIHFRTGGRILTGLAVAVGCIIRVAFGGRDHQTPQMIRSYFEVIRMALRAAFTGRLKFGSPFV